MAANSGPVKAKLPYLPQSHQLGAIGGCYGSMPGTAGDVSFGTGRIQWSSGSTPALLLTNNFEGGTNTTAISTANSGGTSGNAFNAVSVGVGATTAFSTTEYAHGSLSGEFATGGTSTTTYVNWNIASQSKIWFRVYCYFTANPGTAILLWEALQGNTRVSTVAVNTTGTISMQNAAGSGLGTTTHTIPLNQWFRIEGYSIGSATAGATEVKLFCPMDSQVPLETKTATGANTLGAPNACRFGVTQSNVANAGPFWLDDIGISNTGYLGPVSFPGPPSLGKPVRAVLPQYHRRIGGQSSGTVPKIIQLTNTFEGGTNGTTISTGNSGGLSGNAFDVVNVPASGTVAFSNAEAAHGSLSGELATTTAGSPYVAWSNSMGTQNQVWFREYLYFTANPGSAQRVFEPNSGGTAGGGVMVGTSGKLLTVDSSGTTETTSTNSIPLNAWFRIEGYVIGSATAGQVQVALFDSPDSTVSTEVNTTAGNLNTGGPLTVYRFGHGDGSTIANLGPFWMDNIGLSNAGYLGPSINPFPPGYAMSLDSIGLPSIITTFPFT